MIQIQNCEFIDEENRAYLESHMVQYILMFSFVTHHVVWE